jgi:hypothetical protein
MKNGGLAQALQARLLNLISATGGSTVQDQLSSQAIGIRSRRVAAS